MESLPGAGIPRDMPRYVFQRYLDIITGLAKNVQAHSSNSAIRNTTIKDKKPRLLFDCVCLPRVRDVYTKVLKKEEDVKPKVRFHSGLALLIDLPEYYGRLK